MPSVLVKACTVWSPYEGTRRSSYRADCRVVCELLTRCVNLYLDDARVPEQAKIIELANKDDAAFTELLRGYVREAQSTNSRLESRIFFINLISVDSFRVESSIRWSFSGVSCC